MPDDQNLSYEQLILLCGHLQEVLNAMTEVNNGLIERLHASSTFVETDRATLNGWSLVINDIHTASEAHIMEIASIAAPPSVQ